MATTDKPIILIISGAFHVPKSYQTLTTALESAGYEVVIPHLPSCTQARPPTGDLHSDTAHIRAVAEEIFQSGRKVVALAHSYGGQVCSNALHGLGVSSSQNLEDGGGVSALIYMCSWALPEGSTALSKTQEFGNMDLVPLVFDVDGADMTAVPRDPRAAFVDPGGAVSESDASTYLDSLVRWNFRCIQQKTERAAWRDIPVKYIYTTTDRMVPLHYQRSVVEGVERAGVQVETFELDAGHCPCFLTRGVWLILWIGW